MILKILLVLQELSQEDGINCDILQPVLIYCVFCRFEWSVVSLITVRSWKKGQWSVLTGQSNMLKMEWFSLSFIYIKSFCPFLLCWFQRQYFVMETKFFWFDVNKRILNYWNLRINVDKFLTLKKSITDDIKISCTCLNLSNSYTEEFYKILCFQ